MEAEIRLNREEVEQIITEHLQNKGMDVSLVNLDVGKTTMGHGANEYIVVEFKSAICKINI